MINRLTVKSLLATSLLALTATAAIATGGSKPATGLTPYIFKYSDGTSAGFGKIYTTNLGSGTYLAQTGNLYLYQGPLAGQLPLVSNPAAPNYTFVTFFNGSQYADFFYDDLVFPTAAIPLDYNGLMFSNSLIGVEFYYDNRNVPNVLRSLQVTSYGLSTYNVCSFSFATPLDILNQLYFDAISSDPVSALYYFYVLSDAYAATLTGNVGKVVNDLTLVEFEISFDGLYGYISPGTAKNLKNETLAALGVLSS
jgi:hypothetical protein